MSGSKFMVIALFALVVIFGTRWCILTLYSETHAPAGPHVSAAGVQLANPVRESASNPQISYDAVKPPLQETQAAAGS